MDKVSVRTEDALKVFKERLKQGKQKKNKDMSWIMKDDFKRINDSQCICIIYQSNANYETILKKECSYYRLLTYKEKHETSEWIDIVKEKLNQFIENIDSIPA